MYHCTHFWTYKLFSLSFTTILFSLLSSKIISKTVVIMSDTQLLHFVWHE